MFSSHRTSAFHSDFVQIFLHAVQVVKWTRLFWSNASTARRPQRPRRSVSYYVQRSYSTARGGGQKENFKNYGKRWNGEVFLGIWLYDIIIHLGLGGKQLHSKDAS